MLIDIIFQGHVVASLQESHSLNIAGTTAERDAWSSKNVLQTFIQAYNAAYRLDTVGKKQHRVSFTLSYNNKEFHTHDGNANAWSTNKSNAGADVIVYDVADDDSGVDVAMQALNDANSGTCWVSFVIIYDCRVEQIVTRREITVGCSRMFLEQSCTVGSGTLYRIALCMDVCHEHVRYNDVVNVHDALTMSQHAREIIYKIGCSGKFGS